MAVIDGRGMPPAGSAAEWQRGSIDVAPGEPSLRALRIVRFGDAEPVRVARLPDATVSLMFRAHRDGAADLTVLGPITQASYKRSAALDYTVRAILAPGVARAVLGVPLHELADRVVKLDALWSRPARALLDRMAGAPAEHAARELAAAIRQRVPSRPSATDALIAHARARLDAGDAIAPLADELGIAERYLRRAFADRTGLSPKRYARIARLQRVLARLRGPRPDWARLAHELGYFDQSHLVNDFRDLVAATPHAFDPAHPWPASGLDPGPCG